MLLDDALEIRLVTMAVPGSFRVYDGDGTLRADPQAIRLRSEDGALCVHQSEFFEASFEELPGFFLLTGGSAVAADAQKDMPPIVSEMKFGCDAFEAIDFGSLI